MYRFILGGVIGTVISSTVTYIVCDRKRRNSESFLRKELDDALYKVTNKSKEEPKNIDLTFDKVRIVDRFNLTYAILYSDDVLMDRDTEEDISSKLKDKINFNIVRAAKEMDSNHVYVLDTVDNICFVIDISKYSYDYDILGIEPDEDDGDD